VFKVPFQSVLRELPSQGNKASERNEVAVGFVDFPQINKKCLKNIKKTNRYPANQFEWMRVVRIFVPWLVFLHGCGV
jgi:hypothetical protein